jgi:putative ABC transport system ATP-binding protein
MRSGSLASPRDTGNFLRNLLRRGRIPVPARVPVTAPIIAATGVRKVYHTGHTPVEALRGIDFVVQRGEMVAIMGPSGCGKTTLLNCLAGLDDIDAGQVIIAGTDLRDLTDNERTEYRARHMGFIFQNFNLLPVLSAVENVEMPMLVCGVNARQARRRAWEMLERVGLADRGTHRPAELSGGQRQRVTIARALVNDPAIVWADEPTGNLDSEASAEIMDLLVRLNREQGQTFVLVTHSEEVGRRAGRIVRMCDGQILSDKTV